MMSYDSGDGIVERVEAMNAIYKGKCHVVASREGDAVWLEETRRETSGRTLVSVDDPDLILHPSEEDLDLAEAFPTRSRNRNVAARIRRRGQIRFH
jgi:hypothetical protein